MYIYCFYFLMLFFISLLNAAEITENPKVKDSFETIEYIKNHHGHLGVMKAHEDLFIVCRYVSQKY